MPGQIGTGIFLLGLFSFIVGAILLAADIKGQGSADTQWGKFKGPVWFVFMIFGIVIMIVGWTIPF